MCQENNVTETIATEEIKTQDPERLRLPQEDARLSEKDSRLPTLGIPFLSHTFFPGTPNHTLHLTQLAHPSVLPPHLHGLTNHPATDHHLQGFSAFRKYFFLFFLYLRCQHSRFECHVMNKFLTLFLILRYNFNDRIYLFIYSFLHTCIAYFYFKIRNIYIDIKREISTLIE